MRKRVQTHPQTGEQNSSPFETFLRGLAFDEDEPTLSKDLVKSAVAFFFGDEVLFTHVAPTACVDENYVGEELLFIIYVDGEKLHVSLKKNEVRLWYE